MKRKGLLCMILALLLVLPGMRFVRAEEAGSAESKVAGYYVCFETENDTIYPVLRKGTLTLQDGMIVQIGEYRENEPYTVYLDPSCVIFPGLLDLHSHIDYNSMQLWISEEAGSQWDNRFEWRASANYIEALEDKSDFLAEHWEDVLYPGETPVCKGDVIEYFTELQAIAGGTVLIQGANNSDQEYDAADSHEKNRLLRSTAYAEDLNRDSGIPICSMTQIYLPDVQLSSEDPKSYLPPLDTSAWTTKHATKSSTGVDRVKELLEGIAEKTGSGWLIHLAEGRAGYLAPKTDAYSRLEFDTFKQDIASGVEEGLFTVEDIRNAHIGLIHACAVDLFDEDDHDFLAECGIGLIWSPVSNLLLYADTPDFYRFMDDPELNIAIGSDWSPSGSKNVWEEVKFAYDLIGILKQETETTRGNLLKACTLAPAKIIGEDRLGNIREGAFADLFILRAGEDIDGELDAALDVFITGAPENVEAVLIRGETVYGEQDFLTAFTGNNELSAYGQYADGDSKYFRVPELFAGRDLKDLYSDYETLLTEAQVEMSKVRESEDSQYDSTMNDLKNGLEEATSYTP